MDIGPQLGPVCVYAQGDKEAFKLLAVGWIEG